MSCVTFPCLLSGGMSPCCCWIFLSAYATGDHDPFISHLGSTLTCLTLSCTGARLTHYISLAARAGIPFHSAGLTSAHSLQSSCPFSPPVICTRAIHVTCSACQLSRAFTLCRVLECIFHSLHFSENRTLKGALCRYLLYY